MKVCNRCHVEKPLGEFHRHPRLAGGRYHQCRACVSARQAGARRRDPEKYRARCRAWYRGSDARLVRASVMLSDAKRRAATLGLPFDLTLADIEIPTYCPVFGTKLEVETMRGRRNDASPSLDRVDPRRGYTRDNVAVVSWRANRIKSDGAPGEHEAVAIYMRKRGVS